VAAIGATCLFLIPLANGASAATKFDDYQMVGFARGVTFTFSFKNFVLEKILDIGIPHASIELGTSAGGAARAEAAQLFPGDVIAGAAPGALGGLADGLGEAPPPFSTIGGALPRSLPGYSVSYYPPGQSADFDTTSGVLKQKVPTNAGPITVENSRIETMARLGDASASATSHRVLIANGTTPVLEAASIQSKSFAKANGSIVTHTARTTIHDLTLTLSPDVIVKIGGIVTEATTSSNGELGDGDASIKVSDVRVISGETTYAAVIDGKGIHVTAPIPEQLPSGLETNLEDADPTKVEEGITGTGISIRAGSVVKTFDEASAETSVGGLIIAFTGVVPRLPPAPQIVADALEPIIEGIPTYCPAEGKLPRPLNDQEIPPPFDQIFTQLPVCVSPQLIPGPGSGVITTVSLGSVDSLSDASPAFAFEPGGVPPIGPPGDIPGGDFAPGPGGDFGLPGGNGTTPPGGQQTQQPLFGLVARMPPGALLASGLVFIIVAVALAMGPSLRRWRPVT
jgi:hypothetical protein